MWKKVVKNFSLQSINVVNSSIREEEELKDQDEEVNKPDRKKVNLICYEIKWGQWVFSRRVFEREIQRGEDESFM